MDIGKEITNHLEWIENIASLLGNEEITEEDIGVIAKHDMCALGQWLNSEASVLFEDLPEYQKLVESHEEFHKLAGSFITAVQLNNESVAIESHQQFIRMSRKVIDSLHILQEHADKGNDGEFR